MFMLLFTVYKGSAENNGHEIACLTGKRHTFQAAPRLNRLRLFIQCSRVCRK